MNGRVLMEQWTPRKGAGEGTPDGMGAGNGPGCQPPPL